MHIGDQDLDRKAGAVSRLQRNLVRVMFGWTIVASFACGLRVAFAATPIVDAAEMLLVAVPYILVVAAPILSGFLALRWFAPGTDMNQPRIRLARVGRWRSVSGAEARTMRYYGASGLIYSLMLGMLLNVPIRTAEFLFAIPAAGAAPSWYGPLFGVMLADVVLFSSLYVVAFVAALRHVPLFPRLLVTIWAIDLVMQLGIARVMGGTPGLPGSVGGALVSLLDGNIKKVLIGIVLWAPYLLLSRRVNLTYRHRVPA
ncbi:DUF2569 domain-containing protein [Rhizorhabdus argentea]|uniref:DUF2569 domain-containing protein n=1 Tax=Rhizorhabdus argentea TaxID=1387174 RepID=UPI0030ECBE8C